MKRKYMVVYERGKRNFSGFAPDVPGCVSTGKTLDEMRAMMKEALEFHLEGLALDGDQIPQPATKSIAVPFEDEDAGVIGYFVEWLDIHIPKIKAQPRKRIRKAA
jgi:predicted RNase H-like HicB family nuclease